MTINMPAEDLQQALGLIPAYVLMAILSPVFLILALLYVAIHSDRADGAEGDTPFGELALINR